MPAVVVEIRPRGPYDFTRSLRSLLDATRRFDGRSLRAALPTGSGPTLATVVRRRDGMLVAELDGGEPAEALVRLRHILGLDVDLPAFYAAVAGDPDLGPATRAARGLVPTRTATVAQALVRAVCGQLVLAREARRFEAAILRRSCVTVGGLRVPPSQADLRALSTAALASSGLHPRRAEVLGRALRLLDLDGLANRPTAEIRARIEALPGLGPWSAGVVAGEGVGRLDAGLVGDLSLVKLLSFRLGREATVAETAALLDRYAPFQGLASLYLVARSTAARTTGSVAQLAALGARLGAGHGGRATRGASATR